jgi:Anti-sigma factor NepR
MPPRWEANTKVQMSEKLEETGAFAGRNLTLDAIGRQLVALYESYTSSPLPERLTELLTRIDAVERSEQAPDSGK